MLPRLRVLELTLPDAAALERILAGVPDGLHELWLIGSAIGDAGVRAICGATRLSRLRKLALGKIGATPAAADLILQAPHLAGLEKVFVTWSEVGETGFNRLRQTYGDDVVEGWG